MNKIGFPISKKENEKRRALVLDDLQKVKNRELLYFEKGYGIELGFNDDDICSLGCHIVEHQEAISKDIIIDPKIGDADYLEHLDNQIIFGWVHAVQNRDITDKIIKNQLTAYAWEDMYDKGRHVFWRNNQLAGEAAIMHAFQCYGIMPYNTKVALLGRGNVAMGALKTLTLLGADVTVYSRSTEELFKEEIHNYDVIVNAILWDTSRKDHIIYKSDLKLMKKNAMIIDISCDQNGGIETSKPTTIESPYYYEDGIMHYVVDHTPSLYYKTTSIGISEQVCKYIDMLCEGIENNILKKAKCIEHGIILDNRINKFQKR